MTPAQIPVPSPLAGALGVLPGVRGLKPRFEMMQRQSLHTRKARARCADSSGGCGRGFCPTTSSISISSGGARGCAMAKGFACPSPSPTHPWTPTACQTNEISIGASRGTAQTNLGGGSEKKLMGFEIEQGSGYHRRVQRNTRHAKKKRCLRSILVQVIFFTISIHT